MSSPRLATLVRHAHAEWPGFQGRDFDRPLTRRGLAEAEATARAIASAGHRPTLLIASPALRTRQTAEAIAAALALDAACVRFIDELYNAPETVLERHLRDQQAEHVVLVAHNPGISGLARDLSGNNALPPFSPADWRELPLT